MQLDDKVFIYITIKEKFTLSRQIWKNNELVFIFALLKLNLKLFETF